MNWLNEVKWDAQGLVPVIAQEQGTGDVLMFAWMNREALAKFCSPAWTVTAPSPALTWP